MNAYDKLQAEYVKQWNKAHPNALSPQTWRLLSVFITSALMCVCLARCERLREPEMKPAENVWKMFGM